MVGPAKGGAFIWRRSVVVTGCSTGIVRFIFQRLLDDGWAVIGVEIQEALAAEARQAAGERGDVLLFVSGQVIAVDGGAIARCYRFPLDEEFVKKYRPG